MTGPALAWHQFRYDLIAFWRSPAAVFFTVLLPLIFLVIFNGLFGGERLEQLGLQTSTYYVPGILTLAIASATMQSLAMHLTADRESGRLKRMRATPLPTWAFVAGRVGNSLATCVLMVALVIAVGAIFYDVKVPTHTLPGLLVALAVGAFAFSCLGFALTALIPSEEAAAPVANAVLLPLYFVSGVFIPETEIPEGVLRVAEIFPVRHFFEALLTCFDPSTTGPGFSWGNLAIVAVWGIAGLLVAVRGFRWAPRRV
jgi:ABC-2 type transport system permease protein